MTQPQDIVKIDLIGDKLHYNCFVDLSILGYKVVKKFEHYTSEVTINNLYDLNKTAKVNGWELEYSSIAEMVKNNLLTEFKRIREGKKYKTMTDEEIEEECVNIKLYEKLPLKNYQKRAILFGIHVQRACLFLEMGLGKSAIGCTILQHLYNNKLIKRNSTLIVAPKSIHGPDNWEGEVEKFSDLTILNIRKDIEDLNNPYADIFIINAEQFSSLCIDKDGKYIKNNVLAKKNFDCMIFDEAAKLRSPKSNVRECFYKLSKNIKYCMLMTGLPAPNNIFQLWGVTSCVGNWLGDSFSSFQSRYAKQKVIKRPGEIDQRIWVLNQNAEAEIKTRTGFISISMTQAQYLKLPEYKLLNIYVPLPDELRGMYKQLEDDYVLALKSESMLSEKVEEERLVVRLSEDEFDARLLKIIEWEAENENPYIDEYSSIDLLREDLEIAATNSVSVRNKLLQLISGFVYYIDEFKNKIPIRLECHPKLDSIIEHCRKDLKDPENHVIIWTRYREELKLLFDVLSQEWLCAYGKGAMTDNEFNEQINKWLHNPECRIMIAHPGAFMYGHTWNKANFTYYASAPDDNDQYSQSRKRNHRWGQTREVTEKRFILDQTLEKYIWQSTERKIRLDKFLKDVLHL